MSGELRRLPSVRRDDREPIVIVTTRADFRELLGELRGGDEKREPERPLTVKQLGAIYGVDSKRVYEWIEAGMPKVRTGDQRGVRVWPDQARAWLEANRG